MSPRAIAAIAVAGLAGLLWWQTRSGSTAARRQAPAPSGNVDSGDRPVPPPLGAPAVGDHQADERWQPGDYDPADWQPGEEPIGWDRWVADFVRPRPGEGLLEYRDRMVPAAQLAIAPHREAVDRSLDRFAAAAALDREQRAAIDSVIADSQRALTERIRRAVWGGELFGPGVKPIDGVRFARDLLDVVLAADAELRASLRRDQIEALESSRFDVAFYLLVATRWERLVGVE